MGIPIRLDRNCGCAALSRILWLRQQAGGRPEGSAKRPQNDSSNVSINSDSTAISTGEGESEVADHIIKRLRRLNAVDRLLMKSIRISPNDSSHCMPRTMSYDPSVRS